MTTHILKCRQPFYDAIVDGSKTFEVRKNDRGFAVGDVLRLREVTEVYTGRAIDVLVTYVLDDPEFVLPGFVVMGIRAPDYCWHCHDALTPERLHCEACPSVCEDQDCEHCGGADLR